MLWIPISVAATALSSVATAIIIVRLRLNWNLHVSSVRWLFYTLFVYVFLWSTLRCIMYVRLISSLDDTGLVEHRGSILTPADLDCLGLQAFSLMSDSRVVWVVMVVVLGDTSLLGVVVSFIPLTYELSWIAMKSMDRGVQKEGKRIQVYKWLVHGIVLTALVTQVALVIKYRVYNGHVHRLLVAGYVIGVGCVLYMISTLVILRLRGRKYEAVHGIVIASPVYQRLQNILIVYIMFAAPYQVASGIYFSVDGLALSIVTGCSQYCVLRVCDCCLPDDFEAHLDGHRFGKVPLPVLSEPPDANPTFVVTDIESSSALWALAEDAVMDKAVEIHDQILRAGLAVHRGYEITTCGDSFQLAFHSVHDAVSYCMDMQLRLLVAPWPKELHDVVKATQKQRVGHRLVFNGLRVRMGVHDANACEGMLVRSVHAVTGKTTFTGASEMIAQDVSNLGYGGQILVTDRVAAWLEANSSQVDINFSLKYLGYHALPHMNLKIRVFEALPNALKGRRKLWQQQQQQDIATPSTTNPRHPSSTHLQQPEEQPPSPQSNYVQLV